MSSGSLVHEDPVMGLPIQVDPSDALTWCVSIAAGEVRYFTQRIAELSHDDVVVKKRTVSREYGEGEKGHKDVKTVSTGSDVELHILIRERQRAVDRLARLSKMALDAGVAERAVALAERQGDIMVHVIQQVVEALGLTPKQMGRLESALPVILNDLEAPVTVMT